MEVPSSVTYENISLHCGRLYLGVLGDGRHWGTYIRMHEGIFLDINKSTKAIYIIRTQNTQMTQDKVVPYSGKEKSPHGNENSCEGKFLRVALQLNGSVRLGQAVGPR